MRRLLIGPIAAMCLLTWGISAMANEFVVISSEGASNYSPGDIIKDSVAVSLSDGANLILISSDGRKVSIKGPYSQTIGAQAESSGESGAGTVVASLSRLFSTGGTDASAMGVMRSGISTSTIPDPWMIDVSKHGHFCYQEGDNLSLWRPDSAKSTTLRLKNMKTKQKIKLPWPSASENLNWPEAIPLTDGGTYMVSRGGSVTARRLTLHKVPDDLSSLIHKAAWMAEKRCGQQAKLLVISAEINTKVD